MNVLVIPDVLGNIPVVPVNVLVVSNILGNIFNDLEATRTGTLLPTLLPTTTIASKWTKKVKKSWSNLYL